MKKKTNLVVQCESAWGEVSADNGNAGALRGRGHGGHRRLRLRRGGARHQGSESPRGIQTSASMSTKSLFCALRGTTTPPDYWRAEAPGKCVIR